MNFHTYNNSSKGKTGGKSKLCTNQARNPLNQHLYEKISKLKIISESKGFKNQSFCYVKILKSLTKYPMPVLSISQAIEIEGIGDKTALLLSKLLKKQYQISDDKTIGSSQTIAIQGEPKENEPYIENALDFNLSQDFEPNDQFFEDSKYAVNQSLKRPDIGDKCDIDLEPAIKRFLLENPEKKDSDKKGKSKSVYKMPDPESTPGTIMMALLAFQSQESGKYASKKEIKKITEDMTIKCGEINGWGCMKTLIKHEILYSFQFEGVEKYCLSTEGEKMAEKLLDQQLKLIEKTQSQENIEIPIDSLDNYSFAFKEKVYTPVHVVDEKSNGFKEKIDEFLEKNEIVQNKPEIQERSGNMKEKDSIPASNMSLRPIIEINSSQEKTTHKPTIKPLEKKVEEIKQILIPVDMIESLNVVLIVDNREIKNQDDRNYIYKKLSENGLDCELGNLPLGDFLWIARIKEKNSQKNDIKLFLLDYIVERKTCDDLATSIMDRRYENQRARLKLSLIKNAFWLIEGKSTSNSCLSSHVIDCAVEHLQFLYNFKVKRTESLNSSLKWLTQMTLALQRSLKISMKKDKKLSFRISLEEFLEKNTNTINTVGDVFQNMLINIKGCGKQSVNSIAQYFQTPRQLYEALMGITNFEERVELLSLKARKNSKKVGKNGDNGLNIPITLAKRIVILFCEENYPDIQIVSDEEDVLIDNL